MYPVDSWLCRWADARLSRYSQRRQGSHHFAPLRGHYHEAHHPMTKDSGTPPLHQRIQQLETELTHLKAQLQARSDAAAQRQALSTQGTRFQYAMEASRDGLWDWDL